MSGSLVLCGGGLDSYVAAWLNALQYPNERSTLLFFDYGQRAREQEAKATRAIAEVIDENVAGDVSVLEIPLDFFTRIKSSLLGSKPVEENPQAGVAHDWVPGRNTVLMSLALSYAESEGYSRIVCGINAEAAIGYRDNDQKWLSRWRLLVPFATNNAKIDLRAPLVHSMKDGIVTVGNDYRIPWSVPTWSCYGAGVAHCGACSSCRSRRNAFVNAGVTDPTSYLV